MRYIPAQELSEAISRHDRDYIANAVMEVAWDAAKALRVHRHDQEDACSIIITHLWGLVDSGKCGSDPGALAYLRQAARNKAVDAIRALNRRAKRRDVALSDGATAACHAPEAKLSALDIPARRDGETLQGYYLRICQWGNAELPRWPRRRSQYRRCGCKPKLTTGQRVAIVALRTAGVRHGQIAAMVGCSERTISRAF